MSHALPTDSHGLQRSPRRWFQFGLRTLFLLTFFVSLLLAFSVNPARRQQAAVEHLSEEANVLYAGGANPNFAFGMAGWLPRDYVDDVVSVSFSPDDVFRKSSMPPLNAQRLASYLDWLCELKSLKRLNLHNTRVDDVALTHLKVVRSLEELDLSGTTVGDDGMACLAGLTRLRVLNLEGTNITDAGISHLHRLTQLEQLVLADTTITDQSLAQLSFGRMRSLDLTNTTITDQGLQLLAGSTQLRDLRLTRTHVSDEGLWHLRGHDKLIQLSLYGTAVTDKIVATMQCFPLLEVLDLRHTQVTPDVARLLQQSSPLRRIYW